jgi:hypothetical protein
VVWQGSAGDRGPYADQIAMSRMAAKLKDIRAQGCIWLRTVPTAYRTILSSSAAIPNGQVERDGDFATI